MSTTLKWTQRPRFLPRSGTMLNKRKTSPSRLPSSSTTLERTLRPNLSSLLPQPLPSEAQSASKSENPTHNHEKQMVNGVPGGHVMKYGTVLLVPRSGRLRPHSASSRSRRAARAISRSTSSSCQLRCSTVRVPRRVTGSSGNKRLSYHHSVRLAT